MASTELTYNRLLLTILDANPYLSDGSRTVRAYPKDVWGRRQAYGLACAHRGEAFPWIGFRRTPSNLAYCLVVLDAASHLEPTSSGGSESRTPSCTTSRKSNILEPSHRLLRPPRTWPRHTAAR